MGSGERERTLSLDKPNEASVCNEGDSPAHPPAAEKTGLTYSRERERAHAVKAQQISTPFEVEMGSGGGLGPASPGCQERKSARERASREDHGLW